MNQVFSVACLMGLCLTEVVLTHPSNMSRRTVLNENYKGLVESFSIPAEIHERDGKKYASFGSVVPIHSCTPEEVSERAKTTHHYCDIFTEQVLAPLAELVYVRVDETTAEKVFINRTKRILMISSDGALAQWRCAPTFESANTYIAGTPVVTAGGELVSVVTAKRGNHYAVSNIEGDGGYFDTPTPWVELDIPAGHSAYGARTFPSREALRDYVGGLPPAAPGPTTPVLLRGAPPRVALVGGGGRQLAHSYLAGALATHVDYL